MAARAGEGRPSLVAAQSLTLAGNNYDALLEQITALVDEINGRVQLVIAQSIPSAIVGKQKIIGVLTALLDKVPASARAPLASVITALSIGDATEVTNLDAAPARRVVWATCWVTFSAAPPRRAPGSRISADCWPLSSAGLIRRRPGCPQRRSDLVDHRHDQQPPWRLAG